MSFLLPQVALQITAQELWHKKTSIAEGLDIICKLQSYPSMY